MWLWLLSQELASLFIAFLGYLWTMADTSIALQGQRSLKLAQTQQGCGAAAHKGKEFTAERLGLGQSPYS